MALFSWLWRRTGTHHGQRLDRPLFRTANGRPVGRYRPNVEALEDRWLPSTFTVLNTADSGPGSLRAAITAASSGDTINFAAALSHKTITLTSGQLVINKNLDIEGLGANRLTVSGNSSSRVFDISNGATVTLAGLTIANGATVGGLGGGGILNEAGAHLTLSRDVLTSNTATAASNTVDVFGGGFLNEGTATVVSCTFSGNQALGGGGGSFFGGSVGGAIDNFGGASLTVTDSTFLNNQALGSGAGNFGIGGAIENNAGLDLSSPSTATITSCVFIGNFAGGGAGVAGNGGALDNEGPGATMTVSSCLLLGNRSGSSAGAFGVGGGLMNFAGSTCTVLNSALIGNVAAGGVGQTQNGGGIENQAATMTISGSTLTGNLSIGGAGADGVTLLGEGLGGGIM
ncbi:MAG TPA: hypothetical protein VKD72_38805, partial [Gemmataceae bacterium]|nr:hypothetical protein [Gemmataceae bacterium]